GRTPQDGADFGQSGIDLAVFGTVDAAGNVPPTVTTTVADETNETTAKAGGNVTSDGGASVTARGLVWGTSANPVTGGAGQSTNGTGTGSYTAWMTNLVPGQTYHYRAY